MICRLLYVALLLLFLLHNDFWLPHASTWLGLPAAMTYHILLCLAAVLIFAALGRFAWPESLDSEGRTGSGS